MNVRDLSRQGASSAPQLTALEGGRGESSLVSVGHARNLRTTPTGAPREAGEREARRRFRVARESLGLTQLAAAYALGVGATSVEDWERGAARLPAWALVALEARAERRAA